MDLIGVNKRVTIPAGSTQVPVNIPIVNDNLHENTERFTVQIQKIGEVTPAGVTIGTPNLTMVDITDNDC